MSFHQVATVSFQGMVVAFARADAPPTGWTESLSVKTDVYYNVLSLDVDSPSDALDWDGWRRLELPNEVRPSGMQLINVPAEYNRTDRLVDLADAGEPFRAITNQEYLYLLRQAAGGSLLVNRFRLVRQVSPRNAQEVEYVLSPAWEVRFQRSGKPDVPSDDRDVQSYLSPEGEPFIEPTLELPIPGIVDGRFDAALLPRRDGTLLTCTIAVVGDAGEIDVYEIPLDAAGRFLFAGKELVGDHLAADLTFTLQTPDHTAIAVSGRPALAYYLKQERVLGEDASFLVKRAGRLLLALCAQPPGAGRTLATVDFGAAADGTIARPAAALTADPVGVAPYTLDFDASAHVVLPDVVVDDGFGLELWLYPRSDVGSQLIAGNPDDATAPRLSLVEGSVLEVGFTDAAGNPVTARTATLALRREVWSHLRVDFDPGRPAGARFAIRVNGDVLPHDETGTGTTPNGHPITSLSAATAGFIGAVDSLAIYDAAGFDPAHLVGDWPLDTVLYADSHGASIDPPQTPNRKDPAKPGKVFGAHLVPSTSPAATGDGGALSFDARGLSIVAGYFENLAAFGELVSSPALVASADGLVHCYFQGRDDLFSVMQLDVEAARATFQAGWSTAAGPAQSGPVQFVASQAGAFMNSATVTIADPQGGRREAFCDVTLASPSGRVEVWRGVPRSLVPFAVTLNGESVGDPSDPRLVSGAMTYYDASGTRTAAYVPVTGSVDAALAGFVTRQVERLPLASLQVTAVSDELLDLALTHTVPRWPGVTLVQSWPRVPARVAELLRVLDGASTTYPYASSTAANVRSYSIGAESGVMDADTVVFFTRPSVSQVDRIVVRDGSEATLCSVDVALVDDGNARVATWEDVPRRQELFTITIEGTNPDYDYAARAHGDHRAVGAALVLTTNGNAADVDNVSLISPDGLPPDDDLRVYGSLFEAFVTAPVTAGDTLPATGTVTALAFQGASATVDGSRPVPITGGSALFRAHLAAVPAQGSVGLVGDTAGSTGGTAVLIRQGINGGWRNSPDQRTLSYDWDGYVELPTDEAVAPNIGALTIQGDLSLELWCRPRRSTADAFMPNQRLVTFARTPPAAEGGERVRYLAGLQDCPSLKTKADTTIRAGYDTTKGTLYTWFSPIATKGAITPGTVASVSTLGITEPVVSISVDADKHVRADFIPDGQAAPIVSTSTVTADEWYQVALPWSVVRTKPDPDTYQYDFTVDLYVSGGWVGRQQWRTTRPIANPLQLATIVIGEIQPGTRSTLLMRVNEAGFFARALGRGEIGQYAEQRVPDNTADLVWKWMLLDGKGSVATNSAASGAIYDGDIKPSASWEKYGLYARPTLGHGDNVAVLAGEPIIHGWAHLALVHQAGYALDLDGRDYADCGHESTTELSDTFSLEAWVELDAAGGPPQVMTVLGKGDDYELGVTQDGQPRFTVRVRIGEAEQTFELLGTAPLAKAVAHHLAVTYELVTVKLAAGEAIDPRYEVHMALWADGAVVASGMKDASGQYIQYTDIVERVSSSADLNLGRTTRYGGSRYLQGFLSDTRLWTRVLSPGEITEALASRHSPPDHDGLVSWWRFNEAGGRIAFDVQGNNDARLNRGDLRVLYQPTSTNSFYVDGRLASPTWLDGVSSVGGYPEGDQFAFGQLSGDNPIGFYGQIDSVRIWNVQLTGEQISDSMNRRLSGGERHLAGLWTFDNGSGSVVDDATGRGNAGHLVGDRPPVWSVSTAPLGNEAEGVMNILGGVPSPTHDVITETPSVIEYADLQRDAYGALFSVMKRAYVSVDDSALHLVTGYKVGDLDTVYIGQAQSKPSVIGFVEGAPPIPSENQTMPFWKSGGSDLNSYAGASSVAFEEADQTTFVFNADRDTSQTHALLVKGGLYFGDEVKTSAGIGAEVESMAYKYEGHVGVQGGFELADHAKEGVNRSTGATVTMTSSLKPGGTWEPGDKPEDWVNPTVGRRFVPANTGMALVKSLTVDVYASILTTTRSMVKVTSAPNPDIPEDVNILTFPIDPAYVKNGTLDGKVGLENDPAYRNADTNRGSYFKPLEAYALKRRIEREQARLAGYYQQYDVGRYAAQLRSGSSWNDHRQAQRANDAYDWAAHLAKRNIVNTYVWTAAGGTYAEQTSTMNVYTESYGAVTSRTGKIGAVGDIEMTFPVVGFYVDFDYLYSWATEVDVVRNKEASAAFSLTATAEPDSFLYAPTIEGDQVTFPAQPTEGKVDGYRYLAFCLAPTTDNFDALRQRVIDRRWLEQSMDAAAVALREATVAANGSWRVLYRVTFVSRIPPRFQPVPDQTRAPDIEPPANLDENALLVALVERAVGKDDPSPIEIGTAITAVLGTATAPGPLAGLLPWWPQFLRDAGDYRLPAAGILRALREDLLRYMLDTYAARQAELRG